MVYLNASWIPDENAEQLLNERTWLAGIILTGVGYGVVLTLYTMCFSVLIKTMDERNYVQRICLLVYTTCFFIFGTLYLAAGAKMTELSFVDYRLFPGGPAAFEEVMFSLPVDFLGCVAFVLANWMADALVVWRYYVVYKNSRLASYWVMILPGLAYCASIGTGILWLIQNSVPASSPWASSTINFTAPYLGISLALNVTMTIAIVVRLLLFRWRIAGVLGPAQPSPYTSVAAITIESAFLYSASSLLFIIPFAVNHPVQNTFVQLLGETQIVAPLMIIYRVASGAAWSASTPSDLLPRSIPPNRGSVNLRTSVMQFSTAQAQSRHSALSLDLKTAAASREDLVEMKLQSPPPVVDEAQGWASFAVG